LTTRTLRLARTVLRPFEDRDAELLFALHRDADIARVVPFPLHESIEQSRELLARIKARNESGATIGWVITLDGAAIGTVGLIHVDLANAHSDLAYQVLRDRWGSGVAREAVEGVLRVGFEELGLRRIVARIDAMNARSARFAEKLGFVRETTYTEPYEGMERTTHRYVRSVSEAP
jgi:ribosomal-protein-alanine N-acetyltransferase